MFGSNDKAVLEYCTVTFKWDIVSQFIKKGKLTLMRRAFIWQLSPPAW